MNPFFCFCLQHHLPPLSIELSETSVIVLTNALSFFPAMFPHHSHFDVHLQPVQVAHQNQKMLPCQSSRVANKSADGVGGVGHR
jgi:hypothetical protein